MSDKIYLKEITLPIVETGENETYSFVQTDADLDTAGDAADAKKVGDEISDLKQDYNTLSAEVGDIGMYTLGLYPQKEVADVAVASFADGADDIPVKALTVDVTPVQDLHGQANPYPGGGGKNKAKPFGTQTNQGITITTNSKGETTASGTATQEVTFVGGSFTADAGNYYLNGCPNGGNLTTTFDLYIWDTTTSSRPYKWDGTTGSSSIFNANEQAEIKIESGHQYTVTVRFRSGFSPNNIVFRPMLRLSSVSDATFAPYSNICPISGWTGANVGRARKNLIPNTAEPITKNGLTFTVNADKSITVRGTSTASTELDLCSSVMLKSGSYTATTNLTENVNAVYMGVQIKDRATGTNRYIGVRTSPYDFTLGNEYIGKVYIHVDSGTTVNQTFYPMIRFASASDATYEPYQGNVYSISFPTSADTVYGGTLDVTSGVLTVDRAIIDMGDVPWSYRDTDGLLTYYNAAIKEVPNDIVANAVCSNYKVVQRNNQPDKTLSINVYATICVYDSTYTSAASFKTAMSGVQLVYELATPNIAQLSPTEVTTLLRNNNIFADCGNVAELTYRADLKTYIDEKLA